MWGPRFEISCWGSNETEARELRRAVIRDFDFATTSDFRSFIENETEMFFADGSASRAVVDVRVWYDPALEDAS
jgi:site-specific recombinase XerD